MSAEGPTAGPAPRAVGTRAVYDAIATAYADALGDELDHKPLDRAILEALLEYVGAGVVADVGCGPGHVTEFLAARHTPTIGIDLSPGMIGVARERAPGLGFLVGSMVQLPVATGSLAGAVVLYSVIHLTAAERAAAFAELSRTLRPAGWLLMAFHVESDEVAMGEGVRLTTWFDQPVDIETRFLDPTEVVRDLTAAGFEIRAEVRRQPIPAIEHPSRRCYLLAQLG